MICAGDFEYIIQIRYGAAKANDRKWKRIDVDSRYAQALPARIEKRLPLP